MEGISLATHVKDAEINSRIYLQYCHLCKALNISDENNKILLEKILEVSKKLERVKYHRDNCINKIKEEIEKRKANPENIQGDIPLHLIDYSTDIDKEVEACLMQAKSTLDVLAKILQPLAGIHLQTFGKFGQSVIDSLKNNLKDNEKPAGAILIKLIEGNINWLEELRNDRTSIEHYKCIESTGLIDIFDENGYVGSSLPKNKRGISSEVFVNKLYDKLLAFCEDFVPVAMQIKFPPTFYLKVKESSERTEDAPFKFQLMM